MSVVEKLSKLFSKKSEEPQAETSGELSLATPEATLDPMATGSLDAREHDAPMAMAPADPDSVSDDSIAPA